MSASNTFETDLFELIFNGTAIGSIADDASVSPATDLYISLHTGDPGEAGNQTTSEAAYTSYARVAVPRDGTGFTVSGNAVSNTALVTFPTATGGSETITHFGIGLDGAGTGYLMFSGALNSGLVISSGITPAFQAGDLDGTVD